MAKVIVIMLLLVGLFCGCTTTGRQAGVLVEIVGAVSSIALGFDPISGASLAVSGGSSLVGAAVEDAIDNPHKQDEEKGVYRR